MARKKSSKKAKSRFQSGRKNTYEPVHQRKRVAGLQRQRELISRMATTDLAGTPAGRLYLEEYLNREELEADAQFCVLTRRYAQITGVVLGPPRVMSFDLNGGRPGAYEPDEEQIEAVKRDYTEALYVLKQRGLGAFNQVRRCSVFQLECENRIEYKAGLNALADLFNQGRLRKTPRMTGAYAGHGL